MVHLGAAFPEIALLLLDLSGVGRQPGLNDLQGPLKSILDRVEVGLLCIVGHGTRSISIATKDRKGVRTPAHADIEAHG
ncbi:hypothetical protein [Halorhodospira halophila]|uniref:hypothetical protein n=1 Tax=Halorhodospira halophila TaxID=1053 RepID=UPI001F5B3361|nr:hypothetical protein [Halorhodospira halophila]